MNCSWTLTTLKWQQASLDIHQKLQLPVLVAVFISALAWYSVFWTNTFSRCILHLLRSCLQFATKDGIQDICFGKWKSLNRQKAWGVKLFRFFTLLCFIAESRMERTGMDFAREDQFSAWSLSETLIVLHIQIRQKNCASNKRILW